MYYELITYIHDDPFIFITLFYHPSITLDSYFVVIVQTYWYTQEAFMKKGIHMNKTKYLLLSLLAPSLIYCLSGETSNDNARIKQKVNFYGTITTQNGSTMHVDNIAIGGTYKQIKMYLMPKDTTKGYNLSENPVNCGNQYIDLAETKKIEVPSPDIVWKFESKKSGKALEYIEIIVYPSANGSDAKHYLVEIKRQITCDEINNAGPIETILPITALKSLSIEKYENTETKSPAKKKSEKKSTSDEKSNVIEEVATPTKK